MIISDYHLHSSFSIDSIEPIEEMILQSINLNLSEIAITDHFDLDVNSKNKNSSLSDLDNYYQTLTNLKEKYKDKITLKIGLEFGIQKHLSKKLEETTKKYDFDFIILSLHTIDRVLLNVEEFWKGKTVEEAYEEYFTTLLQCIEESDNFSVVGHLDFISRYSPNKEKIDYEKYEPIITKILETLIKKGKGIEINTSGIRYLENRFYPESNLIKQFFQMGGKVFTVGSDAHKKQDICANFKDVEKLLTDLGINYLCSFEKMNTKILTPLIKDHK